MKTVLELLDAAPIAVLEPDHLESLLNQGRLLREENTHISDFIRIVDWNGTILIQEKTDKDEYIVRKMDTQEEADSFFQERLDTYERMWDG